VPLTPLQSETTAPVIAVNVARRSTRQSPLASPLIARALIHWTGRFSSFGVIASPSALSAAGVSLYGAVGSG